MSGLVCKHCGSGSFVKNGLAYGQQRYRCKGCGRSFTATPPWGKPPAMKALAGGAALRLGQRQPGYDQ